MVSVIWQTIFSGVLTLTTIVLAVTTIYLYKTSHVAAVAADKAATAALEVQLPHVYLAYAKQYVKTGPNTTNYVVGRLPRESNFTVALRNTGGGRAIPKSLVYDWAVRESLPETPTFAKELSIAPGAEIPVNGELNPSVRGAMSLTDGEIDAIQSQSKRLWIWGKFTFEDFLGNESELGFALVWDPFFPPPLEYSVEVDHGWAEYKSDPKYSYLRKVSAETP